MLVKIESLLKKPLCKLPKEKHTKQGQEIANTIVDNCKIRTRLNPEAPKITAPSEFLDLTY